MRATVLVVDDDRSIRRTIRMLVQQMGHAPQEAATAQEALDILAAGAIDVALVDLDLDDPTGSDGLQIIKQAASLSPSTRCVMVTGAGQPDDAWQALAAGAFEYVYKTDLNKVLPDIIDQALAWTKAVQDPQFISMIGRSAAMRALQDRIRRVAPLPINALIIGESGTGKEHVARATHAISGCSGPFIAINCAALPQSLLESELFGHQKGSFTGAHTTHRGAFERAASGVLLLDEIGDMPLAVQATLLRVVEQRTFYRVGGDEELPVRCRVLAATHVPLAEKVDANQFRRDLYHRLRRIRLRVPPLRERIEDIPLLTWFFIHRFNEEFGYRIRQVTPEAMDLLSRCSWADNNVRQLLNAISSAMLEADGDTLRAEHFDTEYLGLPGAGSSAAAPAPAPRPSAPRYPDGWLSQPYTAAAREADTHFRRWYLQQALESYPSLSAAAQAVGLRPSNLSRELRKLGLR